MKQFTNLAELVLAIWDASQGKHIDPRLVERNPSFEETHLTQEELELIEDWANSLDDR